MGNYQSAQNTTLLRQVFSNIQADSCPKHYNFHMHTNCSDGRLLPEDLMSQAVKIGLKGMAITDHHSVNGYYRAAEWLEANQIDSIQLWTGMEITAYLPPVDVHILGYGFDAEHPEAGTLRYVRYPGHLSETPASLHRHPPRLGEHSREVLREAGYSDEAIERLIEDNVVGTY